MNSSVQGPSSHRGRGEASITAAWHEGGGIAERRLVVVAHQSLLSLSPRFHLAVVKPQAQGRGLGHQRLLCAGRAGNFLMPAMLGMVIPPSFRGWFCHGVESPAAITGHALAQSCHACHKCDGVFWDCSLDHVQCPGISIPGSIQPWGWAGAAPHPKQSPQLRSGCC